ncbi:MAG: hypothetical protein ACK53W_06855, partial [Gemmatimonadota bacterium]
RAGGWTGPTERPIADAWSASGVLLDVRPPECCPAMPSSTGGARKTCRAADHDATALEALAAGAR